MSRIGAIVKRLYGEDLKSPINVNKNVNKTDAGMNERLNRKESKLTTFKKALGGRRTTVWAVRIVTVLVVLFIIAACIFQYNRFAEWQTKVAACWAGVDRELQRRQNLIPNIVFAVGKYAAYEQGVFKHVSDVRTELKKVKNSGASPAQVSSMLEKALSGLVALAEAYPDLKASNSIQNLIKEATNTEDRIAEAKKEYNKACEAYMQCMTQFPGNYFAIIFRFKPISYIGLEEAVKVPVVNLDMTGQRDRERTERNADVNKAEVNNADVNNTEVNNIDIEAITKQEIKKQKDSEVTSENSEKTEGVKK